MSVINALIVAVGLRRSDYVSASYKRLEDVCGEYHVYDNEDDRKDFAHGISTESL